MSSSQRITAVLYFCSALCLLIGSVVAAVNGGISVSESKSERSVFTMTIPPNHTHIEYEGRYSYGYNNVNNIVQFDMPGFSISFCVTGVQNVSVIISSIGLESPHRFWIYINNTLQEDHYVIDTSNANDSTTYSYPLNLTPFDNNTFYCLKLLKISESNYNSAYTEQQSNYVQFHGIELTSIVYNSQFTSHPLPQLLPLDPSHSSRRKIEFIGDSVMAGYMNMCTEANAPDLSNMGDYAMQSFALAWPVLLAESFNAELHAIGEIVID